MSRPDDEPTDPPSRDTGVTHGSDVTPAATPDPAATTPTPPGYDVERELGRGGMGVVYLARHRGLGRVCALKMMLAGALADAEDRQRFRTEAQTVAQLRHPNVVQIFEVGTHLGQPFMALEYLPGGSLDAKLAAGPLPPRDAAAMVRALAEAMRAVHAANVLHRDLKPANVLLTEAGEPKVTDFGLARRLDDTGLTATGKVVGTLKYMSPEQAHGRRDLAPASDVYSLGAILYECLTGRPPFQAATTMDTLMQVLFAEPVPVRQLNRDVARDLETICHKCLHKDPRRRYADAGGLADDLGRYLGGEPVVARPVGAVERAAKWVRRNAVVSALASVILVVLTAGLVTAAVLAGWAYHERDQAQTAERNVRTEKGRADDEKDRAEAALRRAERLLYANGLSLAQSAFADGDGHLALDYLNACPWDLRRWEHRHLWTRYNARQTLGHASAVRAVAVSPDGKQLATACAAGTAVVWDAATGEALLTLRGHEDELTSVAYSPDGTRLVTGGRDRTARLWDAATGKGLAILQGHAFWVNGVCFTPDGKRVVTGGADKDVRVWDAATGKGLAVHKPHGDEWVNGVAVTPDGARGVTAGQDRTARVWDLATGQVVHTLAGHGDVVFAVAASPDGRHVATASFDKAVKLWDAKTGEEVRTLTGHGQRVTGVAFSPDGRRVATASWDRTVRIWDAATGKEILALRAHYSELWGVCYSPDGRRVYSAGVDGTSRSWDADRGQEVLALTGHGAAVRGVGFRPDGRHVATAGLDKAVRIWDVATGREVAVLRGHPDGASVAAFSPDGTRLVTADASTALVWDVATREKRVQVRGGGGVSFSPDGTRLATGGDARAKVWDARSGRELLVLTGHDRNVNSVAYSPDGTRLVTGSMDRTARIWDAVTGKEIAVLRGHARDVSEVCFSRDGTRVATASYDETARVWEAATGRELLVLRGHTGLVLTVCFSPDGRRVVTGSNDRTAKVWDAVHGQDLLTLKGHTALVNAVRFRPDGRYLVTSSDDGTARLWDGERVQAGFALEGHPSDVAAVAFTADGRRLFAWDETGKVLAWDTEKGTAVEPADPPPRPDDPGPATSPDGFLLAEASGRAVAVLDRRLADPKENHWPPPDRDERRRYHAEQAAEAEKAKQWYAAAFHVGRLLLDDPDNAEFKKRRDDALKKHTS